MARHFSGQRLRDARTAAGLTVEQLALSVGRSFYSISAYERGRATPPVSMVASLADAVGRCVEDLLAEEASHAA
ncbi:helix-turn-helix transcriptional regulator [Streptomyces scabiei]|uniref:helix-turn-helix transcriptional regulator n=1 Tax=Streptomyces scabiei TaxID=1930 RepID=UPI002990551B|nr:helix-turn-helix transcriptional regulator [Streptomyces scabiei]MDW8804617.1 helix-turn-helix transcriptional regulator [Streptomyces scabiei]MDX2652303.1 helix-turn-helix transcriptional regulator [Streptomyces scabiei]MDX2869070.1 helix-turn-helix transcriptional regulator [Streptomyces scabiei]MDX2889664.1 helix-turn-helix transcriptional regulator [Streptomyces scabiei]MDX2892016.1 helix-turn-helix transcriptional regulator [Streptomyces scabiei]